MTTDAARQLRVYALEAKYECLKQMRLPAYQFFALAFPVMFYTIFSLAFGRSGENQGVPFGLYYLASYGAFCVISAALFGFGNAVAMERGQGWMVLKQASPMPPGAYFFAKIATCVVSATTIVLLLTACAFFIAGVRADVATWLRLLATLVAGVFPFCALGLAVGYWVGPNSAPGVVNLINMPMAILSGLWIPIEALPRVFHTIAPWLPAYHFGQLALDAIGAGRHEPVLAHLSVLLIFAATCLAIAYRGYRRDEGKTYG